MKHAHKSHHASRAAVVIAATTLALPIVAGSASAAAEPVVSAPLAVGLAGPLQIAVKGSTTYVGQNFTGTLSKIDSTGAVTKIAQAPEGTEIAGVDISKTGGLVYSTTTGATEDSPATGSAFRRVKTNGHTEYIANIFKYEQKHNPDASNSYGFSGLPAGCASSLPPGIPGDPYAGLIDSHPYAIASEKDDWIVADAAANDLLRVTPSGKVSTLAVLPGQPVLVTQELAEEDGLAPCTVGATYTAEPVPTDVEIGPKGLLYVSTLSGDPAPGAVYTVDPKSGKTTLLAAGFAGAVNLAVTPDGTVYVSELFGGADGSGEISTIVNGVAVPFVAVPSPAALEYANGKLYAGIDALGGPEGGEIVTITR